MNSSGPAGRIDGGNRRSEQGRIVVAATPIGDDADASPHLRALLAEADVVAAEDTRRLRTLAARLKVRITGRVESLYDANEPERAAGLVAAARSGATVLIVSDAGTPLVCDPGFRVVRQAADEGVQVTTAPGPSAALAALTVSGLPTDRFAFEGFWPRKPAAGAALAARLGGEERTMVFFVTARRLGAVLAQMAEAWGATRRGVVCRELTKTHQDIWRGPLAELAARAVEREVLGEVTVVVAGAQPGGGDIKALTAEVRALVATGARLAEAAAEVARRTGTSRRELYEAALRQER